MKEVAKSLPDYSYIYLGDNARTPYGSHSQEVVYQYTVEGVEELFKRGAQLVILACNTASAVALKKIQKEYLPAHHPDKNVLGIIIPVAEEAKSFKSEVIGVFATETTVSSNAFAIEITKMDTALLTVQQACPLLVPIIESGEWEMLEDEVKKYAKALFERNKNIGTVILGCTHYAIIKDMFGKCIPEDVQIISQGRIVADKLGTYLKGHPEIEAKLEKEGRCAFLTTEDSPRIKRLAQLFYGERIDLEVIKIS